MDHADAQIEIALLAGIERQANRTAAALREVLETVRELREEYAAEMPTVKNPKKTKRNTRR